MIFRFGQQGFLKVRKKIILNWQGKVLPNCALWCLYISAQETYLLFCSLWCNVVVVVWCTYNRVKDMDMGFRRSTESPPQLLATSSHDNNYLEETFSILWLWSLYFAIIYFNICFYFPTKISVQLNCMPEQATGFCLVYFFILLILSVTFQIRVTCIAFQILFWPNSLNEICNLCSKFYQVET